MKAREVEKQVSRLIDEHRKGDRLPPLVELAERLGCSVNTLRKALKRLEQAGDVRSVRGSGVYVTRNVSPPVPAPVVMRPRHVRFMLAEDLPDQVATWRRLAAAFEKHNPSVTVEICVVPRLPDRARFEQVQGLLADADLFHLCNSNVTRRLARQNYLLDLLPYVDVTAETDGALGPLYPTSLYALPVTCSIECTVVNRRAAEAVGVSTDELASDTWSEYKALRRRLAGPAGRAGYTVAGSNLSPFSYLKLMGLRFAPISEMDRGQLESIIDQYIDLIYGLADVLRYVGPHMHERYLTSTLAFDTTDICFFRGEGWRSDYVALPLPVAGQGRQLSTVIDVSVTRHTSYPFVTAEFLRFLLSDDAQRILAGAGRVPIRPEFLPQFVEAVRGHFPKVQQVLDRREIIWYLKPDDMPDSLIGDAVDIYIENMIVSGKSSREVAALLHDAIARFQRTRRGQAVAAGA